MRQKLIISICLPLLLIQSVFAEPKPHDRNDFLLGLAFASMVEKKNKVIKDHPMEDKVMEITARILDQAPDNYLFTIQIIEAPVANAFALPGGFLFITDKLLKLDLKDDELAFLIGHEMAHVLRHHHEQRNKEAAKISIVNLLAMIGAIALAQQSHKDDHRRRQQVGSLASSTGPPTIRPENHNLPNLYAPILLGNIFGTLYLMHAFREHELDADYHGAKLAIAAGYSLDKGVGMFEKLFYSNFRNVKYEKWTTHPLTTERIQSLKNKLKYHKQGDFKSANYIDNIRKSYANAYLDAYNHLIVWDSPKLLRQYGIKHNDIRRLLLQRAESMSAGNDIKKRSIRYEIDHYISREVKKTSFLLAEYGVYKQKLIKLKTLGGHVSHAEEKQVFENTKKSLEIHKLNSQKRTPGFRKLDFLIRNFPNDPSIQEWKWQHWLKEPDLDKKTFRLSERLPPTSIYHKEFEEELKKMFEQEDKNPLHLRRISKQLKLDIPVDRMNSVLKKCKTMETLSKYQHEFPDDKYSDLLIQRKSALAEFHFKKGQSLNVAGQKQKAIQSFHQILLYHQGSDIEKLAREQIYKLNTLVPD